MEKTNVMRHLDAQKINYTPHFYDSGLTDGESVAAAVGVDCSMVFKTLVTFSGTECFVFLVPVNRTLNLKKAAKAAGVKKLEMLPQKLLLARTGYIHGGCSPLLMKKKFPTFIHSTAQSIDTIYVSGGKCGAQIEIEPRLLAAETEASFADLTD